MTTSPSSIPEAAARPRFAGAWSTLLAIAAIAAYSFSEHPDRIAFLFGAVMFVVNGAADRVIAHIKEVAK